MSVYFNIDEAVKHVKTIVDKSGCVTCDKLSGVRLRYSCGHVVCGECVDEANECLTCFDYTKTSKPLIDVIQARRVQNASNLLNSFQDALNIDVNRRYRLSEKLKLERQLFPECIQASVKYCNKRKSSQIFSPNNKENLKPTFFAGEGTNCLDSTTMNTRINLVQKWLEKNEKVQTPIRKPFSDINVNSPLTWSTENTQSVNSKRIKLCYSKSNLNKNSKKKINLNIHSSTRVTRRKPLKELIKPSLSKQYNSVKENNQNNKEEGVKCNKLLHDKFKILDKCNKGESSDVIEHLDAILIEDTPTQVIEQDKDATVLKVDEIDANHICMSKPNDSTVYKNYSKTRNEINPKQDKITKNVYFYKKDFLFKSCHVCISNNKTPSLVYQRLNSNDVSIEIETNSILTSITVKRNDQNYKNKVISKCSISTQTNESNVEVNAGKTLEPLTIPSHPENQILSQELFVEHEKSHNGSQEYETCNIETSIDNGKKHNIGTNRSSNSHCFINDSDSDTEINCSGTFEVTADVHKFKEIDYGVLSTVEHDDYQSRVNPTGRRRTIDSNNSSEKENVEPNRIKKPRLGKKQYLKK